MIGITQRFVRRPSRPGLWCAALAMAALFALAPEVCAQSGQKVITVEVNSVVHPITVEILRNAIEQAETTGADAVLIRLNTPGGLMDAMRDCVEVIVASKVPVITWVTPSGARAASAGFFLLEAGDLAVMAPGTNTGAASPVLMGEKIDPVMRKKLEEDASASIRSVAGRRGRNAELAEKTVLEAKAFTEEEALKQNLIDLVAATEAEMFEKMRTHPFKTWNGEERTLNLQAPALVAYKLSWREQVMSAISDPNIAFILMILGVLGIYAEFSNPGFILPGVAGAISVLLGLSALSILPVNWMGVALLLLAVLFFILEANFASHGVLAAGGAVAMALGAIFLIDSPVPELRINAGVAVGVSLGFTVITVFLLSLVIRSARAKVSTGAETMPGKEGLAMEELNPAGRVMVDGDYWNALASSPVPKGAAIRVRSMKGLTLHVDPDPASDRHVSTPTQGG